MGNSENLGTALKYRIEKIGDLEDQGFRLLEDQIFAMPLQKLPEEAVDTTEEPGNEVWFYAALDTRYHRLAVFIADASGQILYKTDQLEANYRYPGEMRQPVKKLASVSFQDVDNDRDTDIILIVQCHNDRGDKGESYKVGDILVPGRWKLLTVIIGLQNNQLLLI